MAREEEASAGRGFLPSGLPRILAEGRPSGTKGGVPVSKATGSYWVRSLLGGADYARVTAAILKLRLCDVCSTRRLSCLSQPYKIGSIIVIIPISHVRKLRLGQIK